MQQNPQYKKVIAMSVAVISIVVVLIILSILQAQNRSGKTEVSIEIVAKNPSLTVNSKNERTGTLFLKPGTYVIKAQSEGFSTVNDNLVVGSEPVKKIYILDPESSDASAWARTNQRRYFEAEKEAGKQSKEDGERFLENNPIAKVLPYRSLLFDIDYRTSVKNPNKIDLLINAGNSTDRELALSHIRNIGYDPADYTIIFTGYQNPFEPERVGE